MKEAIGGGWLLGFVTIFIVIFSSYLAISVNYTKAFKVKNKIINLIEENEGFTISNEIETNPTVNPDTIKDKTQKTTMDKIFLYLNEIGYSYNDIDCPDGLTPFKGGYCIGKVNTSHGTYFKVTTFVHLEIPLMGVNINVPINGETKVIYNVVTDI